MAATVQNSSHKRIESYVPGVRLQNGIYTNLPIVSNSVAGINLNGVGGLFGELQTLTGLTAATTLTAAQSSNIFLLNAAAGFTVTLPTAQVGLWYTFVVQTSVTSNFYEVSVGSSNGFLTGVAQSAASSGGAVSQWVGNGTSHIGIKMNGTTTGGLQGSQFTIICVTTGLWQVDGQLAGSGTLATPFSTT